MSGMDDAVRLSNGDRVYLAEMLAAGPPGDVLLAVDDIDGAVKVKVAGRWSPPIGTLASPAPDRDSARSNRDDLTEEARVIRPPWWVNGADRPDPAEYLDGGR